MTIYDNYVSANKNIDNGASETTPLPRKLPSNHNHVTFENSSLRRMETNIHNGALGGHEGLPHGANLNNDAKKRPLSISSTSSSTSSTSSLPRHQRKKMAAMATSPSASHNLSHLVDQGVSQSGGGGHSNALTVTPDLHLDVLTDEETEAPPDGQMSVSSETNFAVGIKSDGESGNKSGSVSPQQQRFSEPNSNGQSYIDKVVAEIIETEETYVRDLNEIIQGYLCQMRDTPDLDIQEDDVEALFGNIEDIYLFNRVFLEELEKCDASPILIAQCFVDKNEGFVIYTDYCTNYPRSVEVLTDCMRHPDTADVFKQQQVTLKHALPLGAYLLKPVQRILKYHLLLQNILNNFDKSQDGYEVIEEALASMTNMAQHINEMKRKHEHTVRIQEIQSLLFDWHGADLTTYGDLVLEDAFRMYGAKAYRQLFLFEKGVLIAKKKEDGYLMIKASIMCSNLMLIESIPREPLSFHLIPFDNPRMQYTVQAKNLEQKRKWCFELKRLILENYNAVIPDKAKELVMMLGKSREEQDLDDSGLSASETPTRKQHNAPEYLEKRRTRRKSTTILPDFGLMKGHKTKKGTRKGENTSPKCSPPVRRKSDIGYAAEVVAKRIMEEQGVVGEVCRREPSSSTSLSLSERPRSRSLESLEDPFSSKASTEDGSRQSLYHKQSQATSFDDSSNPAVRRSQLLAEDSSLLGTSKATTPNSEGGSDSSGPNVSPVRRAESFRIATELNRVDSLTVQEAVKARQRRHEKRMSNKSQHQVSKATEPDVQKLDDGYVSVVFTDCGFQIVNEETEHSCLEKIALSPSKSSHSEEDESYGDYIELNSVRLQNGANLNDSNNNQGTNSQVIANQHAKSTDNLGVGTGCPPRLTRRKSQTDTKNNSGQSSWSGDHIMRILSDPGTCVPPEDSDIYDNLQTGVYDNVLFGPVETSPRSQCNGNSIHGASPNYLKAAQPAPTVSCGNDPILTHTNEFQADSSKEDPWIPRMKRMGDFTSSGSTGTPVCNGLTSAKRTSVLRRSNSFSLYESSEEVNVCKRNAHKRRPSDTLIFTNRSAFVATFNPKSIVHDISTERVIARLATPPRELGPQDIIREIKESKEHGRIVTRYATPPRTLGDPCHSEDSTVYTNTFNHGTETVTSQHRISDHSNHGGVTSQSPYPARRLKSGNNSEDFWTDLEDYIRSSREMPSLPKFPVGSGAEGQQDMPRPESFCSAISSGLSSPVNSSALHSPTVPSPTSLLSTDSLMDSLKNAVFNLTSKITGRSPRSIESSPSRSPRARSCGAIEELRIEHAQDTQKVKKEKSTDCDSG